MEKSRVVYGAVPNWYRRLRKRDIESDLGEYYSSLTRVRPGAVFATHDLKSLVTQHDGRLIAMENACAHAGARIELRGGVRENARVQCPVHKWSYDTAGNVVGAPNFCKEVRNVSLPRVTHGMWNGYCLGYSQAEIAVLAQFGAKLGLPASAFSSDQFVYMAETIDPLPYPRPLMMINYFDGYHVPLFHRPTFDAVADCSEYEWEFGPKDTRASYSIQLVRSREDVQERVKLLTATLRHKDGTPYSRADLGWADFHLWLKEVMPDAKTPLDPDIFAVWGAFYPYVMPELYEGGRFLAMSYLITDDEDESGEKNRNVVEFYVHQSVPEHLRAEALRRFVSAYKQSAREDDEICEILWSSHRILRSPQPRIYHETLELGDVHYREWFIRHYAQAS